MRGTCVAGIMRESELVRYGYISGVNMNNGVGDQVMGNRTCVWGLEIELNEKENVI